MAESHSHRKYKYAINIQLLIFASLIYSSKANFSRLRFVTFCEKHINESLTTIE